MKFWGTHTLVGSWANIHCKDEITPVSETLVRSGMMIEVHRLATLLCSEGSLKAHCWLCCQLCFWGSDWLLRPWGFSLGLADAHSHASSPQSTKSSRCISILQCVFFRKAGPKTGPHSWVVKWLVISHIQGRPYSYGKHGALLSPLPPPAVLAWTLLPYVEVTVCLETRC